MRVRTEGARSAAPSTTWLRILPGIALFGGFGLFAVSNPEATEGWRLLGDVSIFARRLFGVAWLFLILSAVLAPLVTWLSAPGPAPIVATHDGERTTLLRRGWPGHVGRRLAGACGRGAFALLGCFLLVGYFDPVLLGLTVLIAVAMLADLAALALPGQRPGAVLLQPTGVTERQRGREATVRWDDVVGVTYGPGKVTVRTRHSAPVTSRVVVRGWTGRPRHKRYGLVIDTQGLGVDTRTLALTLHHYASTPFDRHELGAAEGLSTIEALGPDGGPLKGTLTVREDPDASRPAPVRPRYPLARVLMDEVEEADPTLLLERTQEALAAAGASDAELAEYWDEATGNDDRHVLATTRAWVTLVRE